MNLLLLKQLYELIFPYVNSYNKLDIFYYHGTTFNYSLPKCVGTKIQSWMFSFKGRITWFRGCFGQEITCYPSPYKQTIYYGYFAESNVASLFAAHCIREAATKQISSNTRRL